MYVKHENSNDDREGDENHCKEEVLADQRDDQRGGGDGLCYDEEEDG